MHIPFEILGGHDGKLFLTPVPYEDLLRNSPRCILFDFLIFIKFPEHNYQEEKWRIVHFPKRLKFYKNFLNISFHFFVRHFFLYNFYRNRTFITNSKIKKIDLHKLLY